MVDQGLHQPFGDASEVADVCAEAHTECKLAGLVVEEAHARVNEDLDDGVGVFFGDLLDLRRRLPRYP